MIWKTLSQGYTVYYKSHRQPWDQTQASTVTGQQLPTSTMAI